MASSSEERLARSYQLRLDVIAELREKIRQARDAGILEDEYANTVIAQLQSRRADIFNEMNSATGPVLDPPTEAQIEALAAAVGRLHNWNVSAASTAGIVGEFFNLVGIAVNH